MNQVYKSLLCVAVFPPYLQTSSAEKPSELNYRKIFDGPRLDYHPQNDYCAEQRRFETEGPEKRTCDPFNVLHLTFFLSLFLIIAWGAFVRTILKLTGLCIPYTVIIMLTGLIIGMGTHIPEHVWKTSCVDWSVFTKIARMHPKVILYVFLPVLLFESAFTLNHHVFVKSAGQICIIALPGMCITTFMTALACRQFLVTYNWNFSQAALFGAVISATDPVALMGVLQKLGTSESLQTLIAGESLLNSGVTIFFYDVLLRAVEQEIILEGSFVLEKFLRICVGSPILGFLMAKISIFCVSVIFNDAAVEIAATLVSAYLTYFVAEFFLGISGVMAVVVLGLVMNAERTSISPEVETTLHHFWGMLGYLANTVLFSLVGIVITETAYNSFDYDDLAYLAFMFVALNIIRLFMLLVLCPVLRRLGYGMSWQSLLVIMWSGHRGALGICLALQIYSDVHLCAAFPTFGAKFLLLTSGVVFLTLVINGTTTEALLDALRVTELSPGRIQEMNSAFNHVKLTQSRTIAILKNDRFLSDAKWFLVERYTSITNPYEKQSKQVLDKQETENLDHVNQPEEQDISVIYANEPTREEYRDLVEESRLRYLKALKVSFGRQYEQGVLTETAVQILRNAAATAEDQPYCIIHAKDLNQYWVLHGLFPWLHKRLVEQQSVRHDLLPLKPGGRFRVCCWHIATSLWFEYCMVAVILLSLIPIIWEIVLLKKEANTEILARFYRRQIFQTSTEWKELPFYIAEGAFLCIFIAEFIIKISGRGVRDYFCVVKWNWLDLAILIITFCHFLFCTLVLVKFLNIAKNPKLRVLRFVGILRVVRGFRLLRPFVPVFVSFVSRKINAQLFLGYDVGKGFVTALDDVIKFLPQMVTHPKIFRKLKIALETERLQTVKEMGLLQKGHPGIAVAVKTRHASRAVLNQMRAALGELKEDGLIDEKEFSALVTLLEEKMKRLWHSPASLPTVPPEALLNHLPWVVGRKDILEFVTGEAKVVTYDAREVIFDLGDSPEGIIVIISGLIRIDYYPTTEILQNFRKNGIIPNMELHLDLTFETEQADYFSTGTIIGEKGVLTDETRCCTVLCETPVSAFHISQASMLAALRLFNEPLDSLESRLWRSYGIRLATALYPTLPAFAGWTIDRIRMHLERSVVPVNERFESISIPEYISEVVVLRGKVANYHTNEIYTAPSIIPRSCTKITPAADSKVKPQVLVVAQDDFDHEEDLFNDSQLSSPQPNLTTVTQTEERKNVNLHRSTRLWNFNDESRR